MKSKVALVTGGASGIGAATVELLRASGATVVATDISGGDGITALDVTDEAAVDACVAAIVAEHGRLDLAANVAGTSGTYATVADSTTDAWRRTLDVNLDGTYFCLRAELRAMLAAGTGGSIVNVASGAARMGVPGLGAYSASKHAVLGLTKSAALETARSGIRVNAVCPGSTRTTMLRTFAGSDEAFEKMGARSPMGRLGEPGEIAEAIVWLLSDAASFVTGASIEPDGGVAAV